MHRFYAVLTYVFLLNFTTVSAASDTKSQTTMQAEVDAYLKPFVEGKNFTGVVLVAKDGKVLVNKGYGMADYELNVSNSVKTRFHIASVSKPFTASAILILQERGKLNIDDLVAKYVPDFPNSSKITLRQLLTHTSGITNINDLPEFERESRFPQTPQQ